MLQPTDRKIHKYDDVTPQKNSPSLSPHCFCNDMQPPQHKMNILVRGGHAVLVSDLGLKEARNEAHN